MPSDSLPAATDAPLVPPTERFFRRIVDAVTDYAILVLDDEGRIRTWSAGAERIKGWKAEEILGESFERFYPPEVVASGWPQRELELARQHGRFEDEGWRLRKDGSRFWASVVITTLRSPDGEVEGFLKITRDLTQRRLDEDALRQSEERLRILVDAVEDAALYLLDDDGRVRSWNSGAERIKGWTAREILGQDYARFFTPEDRAAGKPARQLEVARRDGQIHDEGWRLRKDGTRFWADTTLIALRNRDGASLGFAKVTRDRTDRKRVEALEEASHQMHEFLAMLGHELRNPLASIRNAAQLLRDLEGLEPDAVQAGEIIERQLAQLTHLVDDLLDVARITSGRITLRRDALDLRQVVERAVESARPLLDARRHELQVELPPQPVALQGDLVRLAQVLHNLLANAAKYTPPAGHVRLRASVAGDEGVLSVRDDGQGMPPELLPRVFDLFVQGERGLDRSEGGLGLGLALVRRLVEGHGGTVEARSAGRGQGSEFLVRLPLARVAAGQLALTPSSRRRPAEARRVLVVDDNRDSADSMALVLRHAGHLVRVAYSGPAALDEFARFEPEVVLLDIGLPGMTGYEVAAALRKRQGERRLHLLAVTGYGQESDRRRSREAGFDGHLVKPVAPDALLGALAAAGR